MADESHTTHDGESVTVSVYPNTTGDLVLRLVQDGVNVVLLAVDESGSERFFGHLLTFEGNSGGHVEVRRHIIADDLELERDNERMTISD